MNIMLKGKRVILFGFLYEILLIPIINGTLRASHFSLSWGGPPQHQAEGPIYWSYGVGYRTGDDFDKSYGELISTNILILKGGQL